MLCYHLANTYWTTHADILRTKQNKQSRNDCYLVMFFGMHSSQYYKVVLKLL